LPAIRTSPEKYRQAIRRLVDLAVQKKGIILPLHDPQLWRAYEKAGDGWLRELRPISDRAIRGYLKATREEKRGKPPGASLRGATTP
jgi:hypothetical protein